MTTTTQTVAADAMPPKGRREFDRTNAKRGTETIRVPINLIRVRPGFNPRELDKPSTQAKIKGLVEAYKADDFVRPIEVAFAKDYYEIVDGECRFTAAQQAGLKDMEVYPLNDVSEADRLVITINGNQGETLTPMEMADVVERLRGMGLKREKIAEKLHKTIGWIDRLIVLSKVHADIRKLVNTDRISMDIVTKVYQADKTEGKLEARDTILKLMAHYKDRIKEAEKNADPDAITNGEGSGIKVTMRDYNDYLDYLAGGRRATDKTTQGAGEGGNDGEGDGEGEGTGSESKSKDSKPKEPSKNAERLGLAREIAFELPEMGVRKSAVRVTQEYTVTLPGKALLLLLKLQDEFAGEMDAEAEKEAKAREKEEADKAAAKEKAEAAAAKKAKEGSKSKGKAPAKVKGKGNGKTARA